MQGSCRPPRLLHGPCGSLSLMYIAAKGVRLGCENLYGGTGGVCMEIWESGRLTIWELGNLEFWKSRYAYVCREIWDPAKNKNSQNQNPCRPKRPQGLDYTIYVYRQNALGFFCKPLQASFQGPENGITMQQFRFLLFNGSGA